MTNDTDAFRALAAHINARGGGQVRLRAVTYIVGKQIRGGERFYAFDAVPILELSGCAGPVVIRGNGARLLCERGLKYGTFDERGNAAKHKMPYLGPGLATPYRAMIGVSNCSGPVVISDIELDGNLPNLVIGGQYGDTGWQIPSIGLRLTNNQGQEQLTRIRTHHHPLDGILIDGIDQVRRARSTIERVRSHHNGRQGCSVTGGHGYDFRDCHFTDTGKSTIASAPGAGVDIEAEAGKRVSDLSFTSCTFANNSGCGLVADSGPSQGVHFEKCTFIGTTNWAAWPNKPTFRFSGCTFVGAIVHAHGDEDPDRACRFIDCEFRDDPCLSPTGEVYGGENPSRPIADLPGNKNVLFDHCRFQLTHRAVLPWTTNVVVFRDCKMSQRAAAQSYPRGTFLGRNVITGNVGLYSSKVRGELIVNGKRVPPPV